MNANAVLLVMTTAAKTVSKLSGISNEQYTDFDTRGSD